jgi:hypothetical protein
MNAKFILGLLLGFAPCAKAAVNFDQGIDVKAVIQQAADSDIKVPESRFPMVTDLTRDCKNITFTQNDPLVSPEVSLVSFETSQDCQNMGYPIGQICFPTSRTYHETPRITITAPRELKPDQKEVFEVCLWGSFLSLKPVSTVYSYSVNQILGNFELTPAIPFRAMEVTKAAEDTCNLVMDSNYSCVYQCKDGSYVSKPSPFGPPPFPGMDMPFHGCRPSVPNTPLITILN